MKTSLPVMLVPLFAATSVAADRTPPNVVFIVVGRRPIRFDGTIDTVDD